MSDISSLQTPVAGSSPLGPNGKSAGALAGNIPGAAGDFLSVLMSALLPMGVAVTPLRTNPLPSSEGGDKALATDPISAQPLDIGEAQDALSEISALPTMLTSETPMPFTALVTGGDRTDVRTDADQSTPSSAKLSQLDLQLRAQMAALAPTFSEGKTTNLDTPLTTDPAALNALDVGGDSLTASGGESPLPVLNAAASDLEPTTDLAARLNAMTIGSPSAEDKNTKVGKKTTDILSAILGKTPANDTGYQGNLTSVLPTVAGAPSQSKTALGPDKSWMELGKATPSEQGDPLLEIDLSFIDPNQLAGGLANAAQMVASATKTATLHSGSAASHAAVHAVALHLQQLAQNRDTRSLTLQLNPPELGRMQIKMTYGRDKSVKADVLIEKSDTFNLMKNDSNALKDALNNAGLQTDASSLNFTLADHGTFTEHQGNSDSEADLGNKTVTSGDAISAIEIKASEEWSVDPKTGIVRYNIIV